jgi:hypothetical protein
MSITVDVNPGFVDILELGLLTANAVILWIYMMATRGILKENRNLVEETKKQVESSKKMVELSNLPHLPNVQIIMLNESNLSMFDNPSIIIFDNSMMLRMRITNFSISNLSFKLLLKKATINLPHEIIFAENCYFNDEEKYILIPSESLELLSGFNTLFKQEQLKDMMKQQRKAIISIYFKIEYDNNKNDILEEWYLYTNDVNTDDDIIIKGQWIGPKRTSES